MTDTQIATVVLATIPTFVLVWVGLLLNNNRLNDVRDLLRAEMSKNHSEMLHRFADLDTRLSRIETHLNLR